MNGDFARVTFDSAARFSRVLLQQGRVLLEADFNEQSAIHHHFLRSLIIDLIGRHWRAGDSFTLAADPQGTADFSISAGHFYLDGILCENDSACSYATQPWPYFPDAEHEPPTAGGLAYLECWERHVSALQYPGLREVALGGIDTASRAQIVWQVRIASQPWVDAHLALVLGALQLRLAIAKPEDRPPIQLVIDHVTATQTAFTNALANFPGAAGDCATAGDLLDALDAARPLMRARAVHDATEDDPCSLSADAAFRSRENQLYRIEVHDSGLADGHATIKWSRENASVVFAIRGAPKLDAESNSISVGLESLGHDHRTGLCEGQWVELTGDAFEFTPVAPPLGQVSKIDRTRQTIVIQLQQKTTVDFAHCTLLKRWDQHDGVSAAGVLQVEEHNSAVWLPLERGVEVQFRVGGYYRTGDYWLVPARVASRDVGWPQAADGPAAIPPHGVQRHRAALAYFKRDAADGWQFGRCGCSMLPLCP
ncbi:hypothetical protein D0T25_27155 [Duganella sp. BJB488]|uniref:DUF6519 domain-containing protein n=1 Tax=unclassified Duganella TaxID=2636909 RepID=UPI000E353009|nr:MULTISPECIES: DUF6519 domain-containing protein [unclassified Duganella]RFP10995.1 hypothetical protein D0T26_26140 [Duganella sp. BJB489]RFP14456.1 hypothetical protein D0T25_27155 [Duganella sp. BJB488]RFP30392.1 hypothetical protein D0T24_27855 [Duganella sp. BJB480]